MTGKRKTRLIEHAGDAVARIHDEIVCTHADYLECVEGIRGDLPQVEHFVALTGARDGWLDYESLVRGTAPTFEPVAIDERDLLTINYTSATTSRPKGVMITHRNAWMNSIGVLVHVPMIVAERYLWTLPMFHANGWTFVWTVTAAGGCHVCLPKIDPAAIFDLIAAEGVTMLCAAPTVLIALAKTPAGARARAPRGVRVLTAGAPPAAATIERMEDDLGWTVTQVYGLTETAPFITICEPRPEHEALSMTDRATIQKYVLHGRRSGIGLQ